MDAGFRCLNPVHRTGQHDIAAIDIDRDLELVLDSDQLPGVGEVPDGVSLERLSGPPPAPARRSRPGNPSEAQTSSRCSAIASGIWVDAAAERIGGQCVHDGAEPLRSRCAAIALRFVPEEPAQRAFGEPAELASGQAAAVHRPRAPGRRSSCDEPAPTSGRDGPRVQAGWTASRASSPATRSRTAGSSVFSPKPAQLATVPRNESIRVGRCWTVGTAPPRCWASSATTRDGWSPSSRAARDGRDHQPLARPAAGDVEQPAFLRGARWLPVPARRHRPQRVGVQQPDPRGRTSGHTPSCTAATMTSGHSSPLDRWAVMTCTALAGPRNSGPGCRPGFAGLRATGRSR